MSRRTLLLLPLLMLWACTSEKPWILENFCCPLYDDDPGPCEQVGYGTQSDCEEARREKIATVSAAGYRAPEYYERCVICRRNPDVGREVEKVGELDEEEGTEM